MPGDGTALNLELMNIDDFITPGISFIIYHFRESEKSRANYFEQAATAEKDGTS